MAAIDLERGLEHTGHGWGQERAELMDNFDSEMQEWEDQLQDIQKKIEELYNEVQARRGANEVLVESQKNVAEMNCGMGQNGSIFASGHQDKSHQHCSNGHFYPVSSNQNGYGYYQNNDIQEIGDILQGYLGQGKQANRKNNGARHVRFSDTIKVSSDVPSHLEDLKSCESERNGQDKFYVSFVENENKKNRVSKVKSSSCREGSMNKENGGGRQPYKQREVQPRTVGTPESPALERKVFGPAGFVDLKGSPSVLRKFGAMLHENEGKLLTESGVVSPPPQTAEPKCPTPSCQRRAMGGRMPSRVSSQKCQADCDVQTAEVETGQDWVSATDYAPQNQRDPKGTHGLPSPQQSPRRAQVQNSPKPRPRAQSTADRDRVRRTAPHQGEPKVDYTVLNGSPAPLRQRAGLRDEGLIELLDMLDIQHEYKSNTGTRHGTRRQDTDLENIEFSHTKPQSFSRPARPANQRPPSRWASRTPSTRIITPSGPLSRPPSPRTRTPSPAPKQRNFFPYSVHTETVIM